jgi:RND family efflux transporter MFP subunit
MTHRNRWTWTLFPALLAAAAGCTAEPPAEQAQPPLVTVAYPTFQKVAADTEEFQGNTVPPPKGNVDVTARVTGYLQRVLFKDGDEVKKDQPLFEIDSRPYQAELDRAQGRVDEADARTTRLTRDLARDKKLVGTGAVSVSDYDKTVGDQSEAAAALKAAKANLGVYKLDVEFCHIVAPISGRISNARIDPGNLVKADVTVLTNIVTLDPIDATFDVDQRILEDLRKKVASGTLKLQEVEADALDRSALGLMVGFGAHYLNVSSELHGLPVNLGLPSERNEKTQMQLFPHHGHIRFIDNRVNAGTGTLRVYATFPNPTVNAEGKPDPNGSTRALIPGLFVRLSVPIGEGYEKQVVAEGALLTEQGQKYVYVVKDGKAERRFVDIGPLKEGNLRVIQPLVRKEDGSIAKGLEPSELVIVNGIQRVRAGKPVRYEGDVPMAKAAAAE